MNISRLIPILHSSGVIIPGQLGPISLDLEFESLLFTLSMSKTGIPSLIHTINSIDESIASIIAEAANFAGHKSLLHLHLSYLWLL